MKPKLGGKICDGVFDGRSGSGFPIGVMTPKIFLELLEYLLEFAQEIFVLSKFFQPGLARKLQHPNRVMIGAVPKLGVKLPEQPAGGRFPGPP